MAKSGTGRYASQGLGGVRRDFNVLRAVRRYRGQPQPTWNEYLRGTRSGRTTYQGLRKK